MELVVSQRDRVALAQGGRSLACHVLHASGMTSSQDSSSAILPQTYLTSVSAGSRTILLKGASPDSLHGHCMASSILLLLEPSGSNRPGLECHC